RTSVLESRIARPPGTGGVSHSLPRLSGSGDGPQAPGAVRATSSGIAMSQVSFVLYLIFVASWFLHLPARYPILGNARADLLLVATILVQSLIVAREPGPQGDRRTQKVLWVLVIYIACSIPFVEWPGSVVKTGFPAFF